MNILTFLNSNLFIGLTAIIVGGLTFLIYFKRRSDDKREIASIVLNEIRNVEKVVDYLMSSPISKSEIKNTSILPTNNWEKYGHLFIHDFDPDEWDLINNFFSKSKLAEKALEELRKNVYNQILHKGNCIQDILGKIAEEAETDDNYKNKKESFLKRFGSDTHLFNPKLPIDELGKSLNRISKLTTSSVGMKLKNLTKQKFLPFL